MRKEKNVIEFYVLANKLKDIVRTGWREWGVERFRVESIAEHIYGVQMLAVAMCSEFKYDINLSKVITMLALHEVEEIIIGDLTCFQITGEEKQKIGRDAVIKTFSKLTDAENLKNLIFEFEDRITPEAKFAYFCDKLECDLQAKLYDEQNCVDLNKQQNNKIMDDPKVKELLNQGLSWSEMWLRFGQDRYNYDEHFLSVSNFAKNNKIME